MPWTKPWTSGSGIFRKKDEREEGKQDEVKAVDGLEAAKALYGGLPTPEAKEKEESEAADRRRKIEEDARTDNRKQVPQAKRTSGGGA